ncbi:MAG: 4-(cytidine 5'-diphospho)-2-C-methyl-D-erythritol kinase [Spirosomataceae bacterium]
MVVFPNAKINIGLQIIEKRPDGYHNLASCFYPVGWSDVLEILPATTTTFQSTGIPIPGNIEGNLCLKAYRNLQQVYDLPPVQIHLHKVVPIGAGLGGGSADGAFTIKALNQLFHLGLSIEQMEAFARPLGSDCAFFIQNQPRYCFEKGDQFESIALSLSGKQIVLVNPNVHISTAEAYSGVKPHLPTVELREALSQPIENWKNLIFNDFEANLLSKYPVITSIKENLYELGAVYVSMTGSGSTVYGIFEKFSNFTEKFSNYTVWQGNLI